MYMPDFFAIDFFKFPFLSIFRIHCNVYVCMNIYMQYNNSGSSSTVNKLPSQRPSEICRRSSTVSMDYTDSPLTLLSLAVAKGLTEVVSIIVADGAMVTTMDAVRKSPIFLSYFILYSISFFFLFFSFTYLYYFDRFLITEIFIQFYFVLSTSLALISSNTTLFTFT